MSGDPVGERQGASRARVSGRIDSTALSEGWGALEQELRDVPTPVIHGDPERRSIFVDAIKIGACSNERLHDLEVSRHGCVEQRWPGCGGNIGIGARCEQ